MASFFGFGAPSADIEIKLKDASSRQQIQGRNDNNDVESQYLFTANDNISGGVAVSIAKGKKLEHLGIKIELIGQIEFQYDKSNPYEFISLVRDLEPVGILDESKNYTFDFANVDKSFETYNGNNVRLRYFLRVKILRSYASNITKTLDLAVQNVMTEPDTNPSIKMEVGIEDCLHIEFEYNRKNYHLSDVVIGKIYFLLVRIKIKYMEIVIVKRETCGSGQGPNTYNESTNISKFELMDGAPVRGESIPIRLFLSPYDLTPTYKNVHNRYSVKYYLNLVLVDEEDRRYFKQQEIHLWRKTLKPQKGSEMEDAKTAIPQKDIE